MERIKRMLKKSGLSTKHINVILEEHPDLKEEDVFSVLTDLNIKSKLKKAQKIFKNENLSIAEKFVLLGQSQQLDTTSIEAAVWKLHDKPPLEDYLIYFREFRRTILPMYLQLAKEGKEQGVFESDYPEEMTQILFTVGFALSQRKLIPLGSTKERAFMKAFDELVICALKADEDFLKGTGGLLI